MKLILTGSLGNVSKPLTQQLVENGHDVTVISSNEQKTPAIRAPGATPAIGSVHDQPFLTNTFAGAHAVYLMVPPDYTQTDHLAYYRALAANYAEAIRQTGVNRVVFLSSWGAHLDKGTGPIVGSYYAEQTLNTLLSTQPHLALTHLRPTSFFTNLYSFTDMIKHAGIIGANYGGADRLVMVHPTDIAAAAAEELQSPTAGSPKSANAHIRYVASDDRPANEIARILGSAIGKPDLQWLTFTDAQTREALLKRGLPHHLADSITELGSAFHNGKLREHYDLHKPTVMGRIKTEDFATEFASRF